jgi:hypothetical protein
MDKQFRERFKANKKSLYVFETCATDTNQVQLIFNSVLDTIINANSKDMGLT